ncbi:MAG: MFS transporter [Gemmatimonadota bacterium]
MTGIPPSATTPAPQRATRREWIGLGVIALPCLLYSMDLTVLNLAIPTLARDLRPSSSQLLWIIDIYGFMVAGFLVTMGTLGDRIGRRRLLLIGAVLFGAASIIAAFSKTAEMLIATRAILGLAGATLAPSTLSLIRNMFHDERERTTAIGIWISSYSIGGAVGPLVGGILLQHFWWGSVFLVAVPVMVLILVFGPLLLPEYKDPNAGRIELLSVFLSLGAVLLSMYGLKRIAETGLEPAFLLLVAVGVMLGVLFIRRQHRISHPFIDLELFRVPAFSAALVVYAATALTMFGIYIYIAQYLQLVEGLDPLTAGLWTVPWALAFVAGSMLTPRIVAGRTIPSVMVGGLAASVIGFLILGALGGRWSLLLLVVGTVILAFGMAPVVTLTNDLVVGTAPPERAGSASAISETCAELSGALGIGLFGSLGTVLYRRRMNSVVTELDPQDAESALSTLGGAVDVAANLEGAGDSLREAAQGAFMTGMEVTAVVCALLIAASIWMVRPGSAAGRAAVRQGPAASK